MRFVTSNRHHKRRIALLLVAGFLFQSLLPLLGHGSLASATNLQVNAQSSLINKGGLLRSFCGPSFINNRGLSNPGDGGEQSMPIQSSSMAFCPACALYDLSHVSLPGVPPLGQIGQLEPEAQPALVQQHFNSYNRYTHNTIRAPPLV